LEAIAIEISSKMAALSASNAPKALTIVADILDIDFPDRSFDGIYAGAFLHLFPETTAASILQKMAVWTKSDGVVFVNTSISERGSHSLELKADYLYRVARFRSRWTEDQFRHLVESNGFRILDRVTTDEQERSKFWVAYVCAPKFDEGSNHGSSI
jgi:ubiquinone/menaquinone biosynthesis C-methylase UbiE